MTIDFSLFICNLVNYINGFFRVDSLFHSFDKPCLIRLSVGIKFGCE